MLVLLLLSLPLLLSSSFLLLLRLSLFFPTLHNGNEFNVYFR